MALILLVDDQPSLLNVLREALEISDHTVEVARNGTEALALLDAGLTPRVILCDIMMPDMDGIAFLRNVRASAVYGGVFFIAMSGNGGDRAPVLAAGADEYLSKPFSIPDLLRLIDRGAGT